MKDQEKKASKERQKESRNEMKIDKLSRLGCIIYKEKKS